VADFVLELELESELGVAAGAGAGVVVLLVSVLELADVVDVVFDGELPRLSFL
jgi:hypothetical protein